MTILVPELFFGGVAIDLDASVDPGDWYGEGSVGEAIALFLQLQFLECRRTNLLTQQSLHFAKLSNDYNRPTHA